MSLKWFICDPFMRKKILLTVTTYPLPSRSYEELVCTAGITEDGSWIRLYPVPLSFLTGLKKHGVVTTTKYTWIELDLVKRTDDFRPESHSPKDYEFKDMIIGEHWGTENNWALRKEICLQNVYTNLENLFSQSRAPDNNSLATFKPTKIISFEVEKDDSDWKPVWQALRQQLDLFSDTKGMISKKPFPKVPYKFFYKIEDDAGVRSRMMIEDWEIGQLYWKCLRDSNQDEHRAIEKVIEKYDLEFRKNKEIYLFLGTTKEWHMRRVKNPFVIIGVFYPKKENQLSLF
mgnify:CR=1 FL=1